MTMRTTLTLLGLLFLWAAPLLYAQEQEAPAALQPLPEEVAAQLNGRVAEIDLLVDDVAAMERQAEGAEGLRAVMYSARLDSLRLSMFSATISLAKDIAAQQKKGFDVTELKQLLLDDLKAFPDKVAAVFERLDKAAQFNYEELGPREIVVNDKKLLRASQRLDAVLDMLVTYTEIAGSMGLDASEQVELLNSFLVETAANRSSFIELAVDQLDLTRSVAAALPGDAELSSWVDAAEERLALSSTALQSATALMRRMNLDTRQYRQQLVRATGALTADVLDVGVFTGLVSEWSKAAFDFSRSEGPRWLFTILLAALIVFASFRLARLVRRLVEKAMMSGKVNMSHLLKRMIVSAAANLTIFLGLLFALSQFGISLGPLLAGLGIVGFIVGFALQDTLSNFASGLMILIYRPFDVGDFVAAGGVTGKVDRMSLVNTTFKTLDNQVLVVPNNMIWQTVITNVTAQRTRRVDLTFAISYSDDIDKAKAILQDVAKNYEAVLETPETNIRVHELGDSSVKLILRPWVKTDDYWDTYWDLTEIVKKRFDEEGITIPFPQRAVHMLEPQ